MNTPYVYVIRHKETDKLYCGVRTKKGCHPNELLKEGGYITSSKIVKNIIKKQGLESFEIINIEIFNTSEEATLAEEVYHEIYDVRGNICYFNQHNAGSKFTTTNLRHNRKHSEETKKKIGEANKGKGKPKSEETRLKMRKPKSESHRKNMMGKTHSIETKEKIGKPKRGIPRSEETKRKLSDANKGKIPSEETLKKMCEANSGENNGMFGKKQSDVAKEKMSISWKNRELIECPHCKKTSNNASAMKRLHFDNCPKKEGYIPKEKEDIKCPHCDKIGSGVIAMKAHHFDNCKLSPNYVPREKRKESPPITCPHCDMKGSASNMSRWHFDNCKHKVSEEAA